VQPFIRRIEMEMEWKRKPVAVEMRDLAANESEAGLAAWLLGCARKIARNGWGNLQRGRGQRRMELVETLQLGGKRQLMLVECDGQRYLVGAGGDAVNSIQSMSSPLGLPSTGLESVEESGRLGQIVSDAAMEGEASEMGRMQ
jgi:hypothetical protein